MSNAHKFVADHGVEAVKQAIEEANAYGGDWIDTKTLEFKKHIPSSDSVFIGELKQVVESVGIVEAIGGLEKAKQFVDAQYYTIEQMLMMKHSGLRAHHVEKAIADYEHVESIKKVNGFGGIGMAKLIEQSVFGESLDLSKAISNYESGGDQ